VLPAKAVEANRLSDIRAMSPKRLAKILLFIEILLFGLGFLPSPLRAQGKVEIDQRRKRFSRRSLISKGPPGLCRFLVATTAHVEAGAYPPGDAVHRTLLG
jgi:hypothetical protein